jgi:hypothetical protein
VKKRFKIGLFVGGLAVAVFWFVASSDSERISSFGFGAQPVTLKQVDSLPLEGLEVAKSVESGESHSIALDLLVSLAKRQQQLAGSDAQTLLSFISAPMPEGLSEGEWEERVNVILNALRVQGKEVPGLTEFLLTTAEQHPSRILRLYAMQHLTLWHHRERSVEKRREIVALFERLAEKDGEESAGAAVMFLNDLARQAEDAGEQGPDPEVIARAALKLAAEPQAKQDVRISALHTCTERRMTEVLPAALTIAADTAAVLPLRKAAVFAIGQLGTAADRVLLENLEAVTPALRPATTQALMHLQE